MSTTTLTPTTSVGISSPRSNRLLGPLADIWAMTRRNLVHISREPMQLSDVTIQPVLFTFLFVFIFGGAIALPGGGSYKDYLLAGILALNLVTSTMGTGVGMATDLHEGMIDRFRALPMWRPAVLIGRSAADFMTSCLCALIVGLTGLVVGWRPDANFLGILSGFLVVLFFAYSLTWIAQCVGLNAKSAESAASFGFIVLFPLAFVSNAMVPTLTMPGWLQAIADWNPVSAVCAAVRDLWGNPNPSHVIQRLADAAPGGGLADLVGGDHCDRRAAGVVLLQQALHGLGPGGACRWSTGRRSTGGGAGRQRFTEVGRGAGFPGLVPRPPRCNGVGRSAISAVGPRSVASGAVTGTPWLGDACSLVEAFRDGEWSPTEALEGSLAAIAEARR